MAVGDGHHASRDDVVRRTGEGAPAARGDGGHRIDVHPTLHVGHGPRFEQGRPAGSQHGVTDGDLVDPSLALRRGDQRLARQALVLVAHDADVVVGAGEEEHELVLDRVGVLVLVDEDVAEPAAVVIEDVGVLLEQFDGDQQEVVEVHGAGLAQASLVFGVDVGDLAFGRCLGPIAVRLDADHLVLGRRDRRVHRPRWETFRVEVEVAQDVAGEPDRVGLVVDRERRRVPQHLRVAAQDAHTCGVERGHPHLLRHRPDERADAGLHLLRGLVGEGDRQDLERRHVLLFDQVGDAVGEHARLARAGTGDDQKRPFGVDDGIELGGIQAFRQSLLRGFRRHRRHLTDLD